MNFGRCVSHLTFHLTGLPPEPLRRPMGTWLYGCDACQNACPLNAGKWDFAEEFPQLYDLAPELSPDRLFNMTQTAYEEIIQPRFWYISKGDIWMWKSNALRAMANSRKAMYHHCIKEACNHPHEHIREMARWAEQSIG
jgi:epoxyqueuosine reductase